VIRHAIAEGLVVLRERAAVSVILAFALGVPIALAGVGLTLHQWLGPVADLSGQKSSVAVLLHPQIESGERRRWIAELATDHPDWTVSEVSSSDLAERLQRWFPYLEDLMDSGDATLPPLVEILTDNPDSVAELEDRAEVLAIGPRSSIQQTLGQVARRLALIVGVVSFVLLAGAVLLAAVWVHLELYRHADEVMRAPFAVHSWSRSRFQELLPVSSRWWALSRRYRAFRSSPRPLACRRCRFPRASSFCNLQPLFFCPCLRP